MENYGKNHNSAACGRACSYERRNAGRFIDGKPSNSYERRKCPTAPTPRNADDHRCRYDGVMCSNYILGTTPMRRHRSGIIEAASNLI